MATAEGSLTISDGKRSALFPVGAFMGYRPEWEVTIPDGQGDPCDVTGHDDFAASVALISCIDRGDSPPCPLPTPGQTFQTHFQFVKPIAVSVPATVRVRRHERPFVVVSVAASNAPPGVTLDGELRIKFCDPGSGPIDEGSWQ
ncbi:MAG: hypothetical protein H0T89_15635 [Deltaproteobacteria bacterium]|nr:hypothetical protein [Deltaproteobacteria bacterium]